MILYFLQRGELEMQSVLMRYPMNSENQHRHVSPNLLRLIKLKKSKSEILRTMNYANDEQFYFDVGFLIQTGYQISKIDMKLLCDLQNIDFVEFRGSIDNSTTTEAVAERNSIFAVRIKYFERTGVQLPVEFVDLAVIYYKTRQHLNQLNIPYLDFDGGNLLNAEKLLINERVPQNFDLDENIPPFRHRTPTVRDILGLMFPDMENYYDYYDGEDSNDDDDDDEQSNNSDNENSEASDQDELPDRSESERASNASDIDNEQASDDGVEEVGNESDGNESDGNESENYEVDFKRRRIM